MQRSAYFDNFFFLCQSIWTVTLVINYSPCFIITQPCISSLPEGNKAILSFYQTLFNFSPERWNELVHLTFFVFLCTLDKRHVYFLHLFLHLHQLCWSACVFFFYVYISSFYCLSSFRKVRTGIWSYLHSWEEVLNQLNQP